MAEAFAWREACDARPGAEASCAEAARKARALLYGAEGVCDTAPPEACLDALEPVSRLLADGRIEERASVALRRICGPQPQGIAEELGWIGCLEGLPLSSQVARSARDSLATELRSEGARWSPGAALALGQAASCLDGGALPSTSLHPARQRIDVEATVEGAYLPDLCASLSLQAIECGDGAIFEVSATLFPVEHGFTTSAREGIYEAGKKRTPNPAWELESERVLAAEKAVRASDGHLKLAETACDQAQRRLYGESLCHDCEARFERDRRCSDRDVLRDLHRERERDRDLAGLALFGLPQTLEEPIFRPYRIEERLHRWEAFYEATVAGRRLLGRIAFEDREHPGFAPAELAADPLEAPTPEAFHDALAERLLRRLEEEVQAWLRDLATERREACPAPTRWEGGWLECWAEASFWSEGDLDGSLLIREAGVPCSDPREAGSLHAKM